MSVQRNRRGFIRDAATMAAAGTVLSTERSEARTSLDTDVIVIGAGMSGVVAASIIRQHRRVIVLEARRDRIGGRIWTSHKWADEPVDLGASWLTHEAINPLRDLADVAGIRLIPSNATNVHVTEADGTPVSQGEYQQLLELWGEIYAEVQLIALKRLASGLPDIPISTAFETVFARRQIDGDTRRRINFAVNFFIKEPHAAELPELGLFNLGNDPYTPGFLDTASIIPNGYLQFVELFAGGLDIRLGHVVDTITYGKNGVAVILDDGRILRARHVLVTVPLGVLKSGSITFLPALPRWKQRSIDKLGFGDSQKIYFRFPHVFWPTEPTFVDRIAETPESRWSTWVDFFKYSGDGGQSGKATLLSFNHGNFAAQIERMTDSQVMDAAFAVLKKQYKDKAVRPIAMQRSHWGTDPYARGVIVHLATGASQLDLLRLGHPVANRVFFAGDSTVDEFFGFVLGAFNSGQREGHRLAHLR